MVPVGDVDVVGSVKVKTEVTRFVRVFRKNSSATSSIKICCLDVSQMGVAPVHNAG